MTSLRLGLRTLNLPMVPHHFFIFCSSEMGRIRFWRVRFQNEELSEFFGPHRVPGREISEFLSASYLCDKTKSPSFSQNSPSLPQNSVRLSEFSSLKQYSRNSIPLPFPSSDRTPKSTHHPHKIDNQHRECKTGGGAYFAFFLASDNSNTTPPPPYMREIDTMWQIGILTGKPCTFLLQNGSFSAFSHYKNKESFSRGFVIELQIPLLVLTPPKSCFLLEFIA